MPVKFEELKILVVENVDRLGTMIESILHAVNTKQVFIARNSDHALVVYKIHTHDLLIVDLDVNTIGGIELTKEIKKEKQNIPVILMASHMHFEAIRQAKEIGITDLLIKPFSFDDLMKHINFVMDGKKT